MASHGLPLAENTRIEASGGLATAQITAPVATFPTFDVRGHRPPITNRRQLLMYLTYLPLVGGLLNNQWLIVIDFVFSTSNKGVSCEQGFILPTRNGWCSAYSRCHQSDENFEDTTNEQLWYDYWILSSCWLNMKGFILLLIIFILPIFLFQLSTQKLYDYWNKKISNCWLAAVCYTHRTMEIISFNIRVNLLIQQNQLVV